MIKIVTDLVEFEGIKKFIQLPVLRNFVEFDVMLLKAMQRQLCLVIHENFEVLEKVKHGT